MICLHLGKIFTKLTRSHLLSCSISPRDDSGRDLLPGTVVDMGRNRIKDQGTIFLSILTDNLHQNLINEMKAFEGEYDLCDRTAAGPADHG